MDILKIWSFFFTIPGMQIKREYDYLHAEYLIELKHPNFTFDEMIDLNYDMKFDNDGIFRIKLSLEKLVNMHKQLT